MKRIAVIFDHLTRPDTTGIYCLRALANLAQTEHFHPCQLADIPRNGVDLYLFIDDGLSCPEANELRPQAFWAIDTHISFPRVVKRAATADCVFAAQREGAVQLAEQLHTPVDWLPLACDPDVHGRQAIAGRFDVCFVGNLIGDERIRLVHLLQRSFGNTYVGRQFLIAHGTATWSRSRSTLPRRRSM